MTLRAIDADSGQGLPNAEFYEENADGEEWGHQIFGENVGSKFVEYGNPVVADAYLTDKDGSFKKFVGANGGFKYGVAKVPAGFELVEPLADVTIDIVDGQARAEQVFRFRRITAKDSGNRNQTNL